jgi:hypothetical protein
MPQTRKHTSGAADPAEALARVLHLKRPVLLRAYRGRLEREDLQACLSQAALKLIIRARRTDSGLVSDAHLANTPEQSSPMSDNCCHPPPGVRAGAAADDSPSGTLRDTVTSMALNPRGPESHTHAQRAGLHGIREWFFGRRAYAHPVLRWASMPLFRLAWIPFLVLVASGYHQDIALAVFLMLIGLSLGADGANWLLLRRQRRATQ